MNGKPPLLSTISLDDKYLVQSGHALMSGVQALVRLPLMQKQRDVAAGLNTAGYISGYRGSPLGGYDQALWKAQKHLDLHNIVFQPGLNEDLAMTAVWGSQQLHLSSGAKHQGVFGLWYGKGPGVDRSGDVLKHANAAGSAQHGGVLAVMGDDHGAKSSSFPHQSEQAAIAALTPILHAGNVQDVLHLGLAGWAMSRFSGCWSALKITSDVADATAVVSVSPDTPRFIIPAFEAPPLHLRWPDPPLEQELRLIKYKLPAALEFARVNKLNFETLRSPTPRLGLIAPGKSYYDVCQALDELGLSEDEAKAAGLSLFKVSMPWPLEPEGIKNFAAGHMALFVIEEKRGVVEPQVKDILYHLPADRRPEVIGKRDAKGGPLLPETGEISTIRMAIHIANQLLALGGPEFLAERVERLRRLNRDEVQDIFERKPHYCSGCPHNTSTVVPEGSRALAGIGCHYMAMWMERKTATFSQMGGEGIPWLGTAPFTSEKHIFANLGDGTYQHSGLLAIRAAVSAKVNITYKILYNDAVAMTGGQKVEGAPSVAQISQQVAAEGVAKIVVVTDEVKPYPGLAAGVKVRHRRDLEAVQQELRETPGTTVLIYDQTCAAEKRRRRKRGTMPTPNKHVIINDLVCEGCGDCSKKSNCLSVVPIETEFGTKRTIDQSSCNKDFSCLEGFCPSFVTVIGGKLKKPTAQNISHLPAPPEPILPSLERPWNILVSGVGGTGIITIGALLAMAAHLEGKAATTLDQTGLAQKGGAVWSHVRIAATPEQLKAVRLPAGTADLLLAGDVVVAAAQETLRRVSPEHTCVVLNTEETITASFTRNPDSRAPNEKLLHRLSEMVQQTHPINASRIAVQLLGDTIATNLFLLGYAWQLGRVPVSREAIEQAVRLNGVQVDMNLNAFLAGRLTATGFPLPFTGGRSAHSRSEGGGISADLNDIITRRVQFLTAYQSKAYAAKYLAVVEKVRAAEAPLNSTALTEAVAKNLFKLMAYKDEYEVARLYTDGAFAKRLTAEFEGPVKLNFHLAPPLLASKNKLIFGPWMLGAFKLLAKFKFLRGTPLDIFGYTHERQTERQLVKDYSATLATLLPKLTPTTHEAFVAWASLPQKIRGFGHVKAANLVAVKAEEVELITRWR